VVTPAARRGVVGQLTERFGVSERRVCRITGFARSSHRYCSRSRRDDGPVRERLLELAARYPRYGSPTLHGMLHAEGRVTNHKRTERIYRAAGLQVPRRRRKHLTRPHRALPPAGRINERWSLDFVHDQLASGRRFRVLNIVDDCSRECVAQLADTSISGHRITRLLDELAKRRGLPEMFVMDNGSEFTSKALFHWAKRHGVELHFIEPGKPTQNAYVESFNGKFREYCLDLHWFVSLDDARRHIRDWGVHYNTVRPHSALGTTPERFAQRAQKLKLGAPPPVTSSIGSPPKSQVAQELERVSL
jgi:putative transposase